MELKLMDCEDFPVELLANQVMVDKPQATISQFPY